MVVVAFDRITKNIPHSRHYRNQGGNAERLPRTKIGRENTLKSINLMKAVKIKQKYQNNLMMR